jgi:hypothetical protein
MGYPQRPIPGVEIVLDSDEGKLAGRRERIWMVWRGARSAERARGACAVVSAVHLASLNTDAGCSSVAQVVQ